MSFVRDLINLTSIYESPESFWKWGAYATIAATLRDNFYCDHGLFRTYCNMYVLYVAKSGESRKGAPFKIVSSLLHDPICRSTKIFQGRASVQGIIDTLSKHEQRNGIQLQGGSCMVLADELASAFVEDPSMIPLITDMYDARENFYYNLRSTGRIEVRGLCVSMLAASNEQLLTKVYSGDAVYGGLLGRTMVITPNEVRPANSLLYVDAKEMSIAPLAKQLKEIRDKIKGPAKLTEDAKKLYDAWYKKLYGSYAHAEDTTGVLQRIHVNALKLSMILSAAELTTEVNEERMQNAIDELTALRGNYRKFELSSGRSDEASIGATFLHHLFTCDSYSDNRKGFLSVYWKDISAENFDKLAQTLEGAGLIKVTPRGSNPIYTLSEKSIAKFKGEK